MSQSGSAVAMRRADKDISVVGEHESTALGSRRSIIDLLRHVTDVSPAVLMAFFAAFLLPFGMILAIAFGGWLYFGPLLIGIMLVSYKINRARHTRPRAYDDKIFTRSEKSLDEYLEIVRRSREKNHEA